MNEYRVWQASIIADKSSSQRTIASTANANIVSLMEAARDAKTSALSGRTVFGSQQRSSGDIAGTVRASSGNSSVEYALLWTGGGQSVSVLPPAPGATSRNATGINDAGVIVGYYIGSGGRSYPMRWTPNGTGGYTISTVGTSTSANLSGSINTCGRAVGSISGKGYVWDASGALTLLPLLPGASEAGQMPLMMRVPSSAQRSSWPKEKALTSRRFGLEFLRAKKQVRSGLASTEKSVHRRRPRSTVLGLIVLEEHVRFIPGLTRYALRPLDERGLVVIELVQAQISP
jgi:hypothetical protein